MYCPVYSDKMAAVSNQFGTLGDDNDAKPSDDEELSFGKMIAEAVEAAVNSETGKRREDTRMQNKSKAKGAPTHEGAITGEGVARMIATLQPVLVKSVD